mmetsp:Transcript_18380/g.69545  ORF Transcript_18380/g.69545 Transcript_18380/m.69545 type:complete len:284 (+) Transcript_18380:419-1270(+)
MHSFDLGEANRPESPERMRHVMSGLQLAEASDAPNPRVEIHGIVEQGIDRAHKGQHGWQGLEDLIRREVRRHAGVLGREPLSVGLRDHLQDAAWQNRVAGAHDARRAHASTNVERRTAQHEAIRHAHACTSVVRGLTAHSGCFCCSRLPRPWRGRSFLGREGLHRHVAVDAELDTEGGGHVPPRAFATDYNLAGAEAQDLRRAPVHEALVDVVDLRDRDGIPMLRHQIVLGQHDDRVGGPTPLAQERYVGGRGVDEPATSSYVQNHVVLRSQLGDAPLIRAPP